MSSYRQYLSIAQVASITGVTVADPLLIESAESDIDSYVMDKMDLLNQNYLKSMTGVCEFSPTECIYTDATLTLPANGYVTNYFQFTVIEILSGSKKGTRIPVTSSNGGVLNFDSVTGLADTSGAVKIYQIGVFPRIIDSNNYGKSIPYQVLEAVAWQTAHLSTFGSNAASAVSTNSKKAKLKSESIGSGYSYTLSDSTNSADLVSPKAIAILATLI